MEPCNGKWRVIGGQTGLVGLAYSLFYDGDGMTPSWLILVQHAGGTKRHRLGIVVEAVRRQSLNTVEFEGRIQACDGFTVSKRIVGTLYVWNGTGDCVVSE